MIVRVLLFILWQEWDTNGQKLAISCNRRPKLWPYTLLLETVRLFETFAANFVIKVMVPNVFIISYVAFQAWFSWFEILNMEHSANMTIKFEAITNEYETWQTVAIAVIWFVIETIGNGLLLSLIHYYKFGGDPLKWRIVDHVSLAFQFANPCESLRVPLDSCGSLGLPGSPCESLQVLE